MAARRFADKLQDDDPLTWAAFVVRFGVSTRLDLENYNDFMQDEVGDSSTVTVRQVGLQKLLPMETDSEFVPQFNAMQRRAHAVSVSKGWHERPVCSEPVAGTCDENGDVREFGLGLGIDHNRSG